MKSPKMITKELLDPSLIEELNNKADITASRQKSDNISEDDLSAELRKKIQSWGVGNPGAYDDTEIRNRVVAIENDYASKSKAFDKTVEKVDYNLLENSIQKSIDKIKVNEDNIKTLTNTAPNKDSVRMKSDIIHMIDLSADLRNKITTSYSYYQSVIPSGNNIQAMDLPTINASLTKLNNTKANKNELNNYRDKKTLIAKTDLTNELADSINNGEKAYEGLKDKADNSILENYRKTANPIEEKDLDVALAGKIKAGNDAATNLTGVISSVVASECDTMHSEIKQKDIGNVYNQSFLPITYQRQVNDTKVDTTEQDKYDIIDILNWLHNYICGDQYKKITAETQKAICQSESIEQSTHVDAAGESYYGVSYGLFTYADVSNYIFKKISAINEKLSDKSLDVSSLSKSITEMKKDIADLTTEVENIKTDITDIKTDISTIKTTVSGLDNRIKALESK